MNIITRYLGKSIILHIALVILFLFGLQAFIEFTREFRQMGIGNYNIIKVALCVLYMLPTDVYQFFPMAGLLGCVLSLGLLASHSELIIMRASGFSIFNITSAIIKSVLALIVVMFIIGEGLAPMAQKHAVRRKAIEMSGGQIMVNHQGLWARSGNKDFIHVDSVLGADNLHGVTRYEFDDEYKLKSASYATDGLYKNGKWIFNNVVQTVFYPNKISSNKLPSQEWPLVLNRRLIGMNTIEPDQESLIKLYSYIKHRKEGGLNTVSYELVFWQRVFAPLSTLVMILLAIPFAFGPLRSTTMGLRMLVGIVVGFCFYIFDKFVGPMSYVYQIPPILAAILPAMLFATINMGLLWIYRVN